MADAVDNGVNVEALLEARKALTEAPEAAQFTWRASCEWKDGTYSHSTAEGFFGLGEEQARTTVVHLAARPHSRPAAGGRGATPEQWVNGSYVEHGRPGRR